MSDANNVLPASVRSGEAKRIHIIAICGVAMAALAGMLKQRGFDVGNARKSRMLICAADLKRYFLSFADRFDRR